MNRLNRAQLQALVDEATVDAHDQDEQVMGLHTMIEDNLALPFETTVLGVGVTVDSVDLNDRGDIVAFCSRDRLQQSIPLLDLPLPSPPPQGAEWIEAYRHWASPASD